MLEILKNVSRKLKTCMGSLQDSISPLVITGMFCIGIEIFLSSCCKNDVEILFSLEIQEMLMNPFCLLASIRLISQARNKRALKAVPHSVLLIFGLVPTKAVFL